MRELQSCLRDSPSRTPTRRWRDPRTTRERHWKHPGLTRIPLDCYNLSYRIKQARKALTMTCRLLELSLYRQHTIDSADQYWQHWGSYLKIPCSWDWEVPASDWDQNPNRADEWRQKWYWLHEPTRYSEHMQRQPQPQSWKHNLRELQSLLCGFVALRHPWVSYEDEKWGNGSKVRTAYWTRAYHFV